MDGNEREGRVYTEEDVAKRLSVLNKKMDELISLVAHIERGVGFFVALTIFGFIVLGLVLIIQ